MPTATRNRPSPAKKPAPDPLRLRDPATSPVDRLEQEIHRQRRQVGDAEQKLADERRALAFLEGKAARIAQLINNGGALARAVDAKPFDAKLVVLLKRCKQAPWVKLQRAGASDEQIATVLKTGWPDYTYSNTPTRAEGNYGKPRVFIDVKGYGVKPTLEGKPLIAETRRVMGIPQPKPQPAHKPTPAKKKPTQGAAAASPASTPKRPAAKKKGGKGGAGGPGASKASTAAASKPAAADDADEDLDAAGAGAMIETIEDGETYSAGELGIDPASLERSMPPADNGGLRGSTPDDKRGGRIGAPLTLCDGFAWAVVGASVQGGRTVYALQPINHPAREHCPHPLEWAARRAKFSKMSPDEVPLTGLVVEDPTGRKLQFGPDHERIFCEVPRSPAANDTRVVSAPAGDDTRVVQADKSAGSKGRDEVLRDALHRHAGADKRWAELQREGARDAELRAAIGEEFGILGGGGGPGYTYSVRGGADPAFWRGSSHKAPKSALKGKELVAEVRSLMRIPTRNYSVARLAELQAAQRTEQDAGDVVITTIPAHVGMVTLTPWTDKARGEWYCGADVDLSPGNLGKKVIRPLSRPAFGDRAAAIADTAAHLLDQAEALVRSLPPAKVVNGRAVVAALRRFLEEHESRSTRDAAGEKGNPPAPDEGPLGTSAWAKAMGFGDQVSEQRARTIAALPAARRHLMKDGRVNDAGEYHRPPAGGEEEVTRCGEAGELQLYLSRDGDGGWHAGHNLYWRRVSLGSHCERARVDGVVYEDRAEALQGELAAVLKLVDAIKGPPATKADQDDARAMGKHLRDWGRDQAKRATQAAAAIAAKAPPPAKSKPKPNGRGGPPLHPVAAAVLATGGPLVTGVAGGPLN